MKAQAGRKIDYSGEGGAVFLALRLGGLSLWLYCLMYMAYPRPLTWSFIELPSAVRWSGAFLVVLLIPIIVSAQRALGRNVSPTVMTHDDHELVTDGPYRWVRNPLYTAGAMVLANCLLSPEAQLSKAHPDVWGDIPAIDPALLPADWQQQFSELPRGVATLPSDVLAAHRLPELQSPWLIAIEQGWEENVLQK